MLRAATLRAALLATTLLSPLAAHAASLVGNITQGTGGAVAVQDAWWQAASFTTGGIDAFFSGVQLDMAAGTSGGGFFVDLYSGTPGAVGTSLITLTGDPDPDIAGLYSYTTPGTFVLNANTTYWVVAGVAGTGAYNWNYATADGQDPGSITGWDILDVYADTVNDGTNWAVNPAGGSPNRFTVQGQQVPEPSLQAGAALLGLIGLLGWRRRKTSAAA